MQGAIILVIGVLLLCSIIFYKTGKTLNTPSVTLFLIFGYVIGPGVLNLLPQVSDGFFNTLNNIVISFFSFNIGLVLSKERIRGIDRDIYKAAFGQISGSFILVFLLVNFVFGKSFEAAAGLACIAGAASPIASVLITGRKGKTANLLLGTGAVSEAVILILFSVTLQIVTVINKSPAIDNIVLISGLIILNIIKSLLLGILIGIIAKKTAARYKTRSETIICTIGLILLTAGLSINLKIQPAISIFTMAFIISNDRDAAFKYQDSFRGLDIPFYVLLFLLMGTKLSHSVILSVLLPALLIIAVRMSGKALGIIIINLLYNIKANIKKLPLGLMSSTGIALFIAVVFSEYVPEGKVFFLTLAITISLISDFLSMGLLKVFYNRKY